MTYPSCVDPFQLQEEKGLDWDVRKSMQTASSPADVSGDAQTG